MNDASVVMDSLPYIEAVHQDYEEYALALIEEEMKQSQPRPLKKMPPIKFRSSLMKAEYAARVVDNEFVPRGEDEQSFQPPKIARPISLDEWRNVALPQARTQFEAERIRGLTVDAEKDEAVVNWKAYLSQVIEPLQAQWTKALADQREAVEEINYQRQQAQEQQYGPQLDQLTTDYQQMVYRRNQLEHANEGLRRELSLKRKRDENA